MKVAIALVGLLFTAAAYAADFDCSKAATPIEQEICSNPELSTLDEQLASAYRGALTSTANPSQLKSEQIAWITQIRNKCEEKNCLKVSYENRIRALTGSSSEQLSEANDQPTNNQPAVIQPESEQPQITKQEVLVQQAGPTEQDNSLPVLLPTSGMPAASGTQDAAGVLSETHQESKITSLQLKLLGLVILINALVTIYLHKGEKLVIYRDYTDAAFTGLAPLAAIGTYFLLLFFEMPNNISQIIGLSIFAILMLFVVKSTARNNNGLSGFFVMSLITKVTIVGLYYAIMAWLVFGSNSARKKGESYAAYEARKRREAKANAAAMAATTAGFVALSAWVCRYAEFTPLKEYISTKEAAD